MPVTAGTPRRWRWTCGCAHRQAWVLTHGGGEEPMEKRYEFEGAEVRALVEESRAAGERLMTEAQRYLAAGIDLHDEAADWDGEVDHPGTGADPGLWLMNDRGVYLRSNAK